MLTCSQQMSCEPNVAEAAIQTGHKTIQARAAGRTRARTVDHATMTVRCEQTGPNRDIHIDVEIESSVRWPSQRCPTVNVQQLACDACGR